MTYYSRGVHGRDEIESGVTSARGLQGDKGLHVLQVVDLVVQTLAGVRVNCKNQGLIGGECARREKKYKY